MDIKKKYDEKIKKLGEEIKELEKAKEKELVEHGKAFFCNRCNRFVSLGDATPREQDEHICYHCKRILVSEKKKKDLLEKLKNAVIVDVKTDDYRLKSITVYKDGMMREIDSFCDENLSVMHIRNEWKEHYSPEQKQVKPWMKPMPKTQEKIVVK